MKKIAVILGMMSFLILFTGTINVHAKDMDSNSNAMANSIEGGQIMDSEVRVRVISDGVKIKKSPFPWAETLRVANKGETFKYTGHYLGYYHIYVGNEIFFISDNEKKTETYSAPLK